MNQNQEQLNITPYAILAAVLFYSGKTEVLKVKPDDTSQEVEVTANIISIESDNDACVCMIPMDKVIKFAMQVFDCKVQIDGAVMLITFEKRAATSGLVTATGQQILPKSEKIQELISRLK